MDLEPNGADEQGPPTKRLRSSEPLDETILAASDTDITMNGHDDTEPEAAPTPVVTPRKRGRPPKQTPTKSPATPSTPVPRNPDTTYLTPLKATGPNASTPGRNAADRSARRKTARTLLEQATGDGASDDDAGVEDDNEDLARAIFGDTDDEDDDDEDGDETEVSIGEGLSDGEGLLPDEAAAAAAQPAKKKRAPRKRAKSPTPPRDLPPQEMYFFHNKPGRPKTSDNTLAGLRLLTHDEYFDVLRKNGPLTRRHAADVANLEALHAESFPQWALEMAQGFSLCLYGFGSKRAVVRSFATHLYNLRPESPIVMVNGYAPTTNIREILSCVATAVFGDKKKTLPSTQPLAMTQSILAHLTATPSASVTIIVNSIDASPLRRAASAQSILSTLASHPSVHLLCSADAPDFSLLWDVGVRSAYNFVFHDCTTFAPMAVELDAVDEVHELLGRKAHRVHGREGVAFVLKSLPENAKNLFRLLVGEVLVAMDEDVDGAAAGEEGGAGVEYRMVYNKAVEEFVCSSEMAFRTLLKEYVCPVLTTSDSFFFSPWLLTFPQIPRPSNHYKSKRRAGNRAAQPAIQTRRAGGDFGRSHGINGRLSLSHFYTSGAF